MNSKIELKSKSEALLAKKGFAKLIFLNYLKKIKKRIVKEQYKIKK